MRITFDVPGEPRPKGSFRTIHDRTGKVRVINDNPRTKAWQNAVGWAARVAMAGRPPLRCAVIVEAHFRCEWEGAGEPSGVPYVDGDKLLRALWDGMSKIVYTDDSLIVGWPGSKSWGPPGVSVIVTPASLAR